MLLVSFYSLKLLIKFNIIFQQISIIGLQHFVFIRKSRNYFLVFGFLLHRPCKTDIMVLYGVSFGNQIATVARKVNLFAIVEPVGF